MSLITVSIRGRYKQKAEWNSQEIPFRLCANHLRRERITSIVTGLSKSTFLVNFYKQPCVYTTSGVDLNHVSSRKFVET